MWLTILNNPLISTILFGRFDWEKKEKTKIINEKCQIECPTTIYQCWPALHRLVEKAAGQTKHGVQLFFNWSSLPLKRRCGRPTTTREGHNSEKQRNKRIRLETLVWLKQAYSNLKYRVMRFLAVERIWMTHSEFWSAQPKLRGLYPKVLHKIVRSLVRLL